MRGTSGVGPGAEQLALLGTLLNFMPVMVVWHERDGRVRLLNRAFAAATGWSDEQVPGIDLMAACCPNPAYRAAVLEHLAAGTGTWRDVMLTRRDGGTLWTSWTGVRLADGSYVGLGVDISQRQHREDELEARVGLRTMELAEAHAALAAQHERLRGVLDQLFAFVGLLTPDGVLIEVNRAPVEAAGLT
jgi:PAS domain S-box-containing protein